MVKPGLIGGTLTLGLAGLHSSRRGDHRVIYANDDGQRAVEIVAIEHRADVNRRK